MKTIYCKITGVVRSRTVSEAKAAKLVSKGWSLTDPNAVEEKPKRGRKPKVVSNDD